MSIKNLRSNAPPKGSVKRTNKILWGDWNDQPARCVIYNRVDEAEPKSLEGASMSNDQFQQIMNQMSLMMDTKLAPITAEITSIKSGMASMQGQISSLDNRMTSIEAKLDNLTKIVKKNHPDDFDN